MVMIRSSIACRGPGDDTGGNRGADSWKKIAVLQGTIDQLAVAGVELRTGQLDDLHEYELEIVEQGAELGVVSGG
jgi:hypothetical protein